MLQRALAGAAAGTAYRAPELVDARRPTFRFDVYSLGVLFLELLTCKSPAHHASLEGGDGVVDLPRWGQSVVREEWTAEVFGSAPPAVRPPGRRGLRLLLQRMDCRGSGKSKEKAIPDSDEVCSAAGGSSKTYVVDRAGKRIELKGKIRDT
ncbi:probable inactive receptor kinase At3g02880 [Panicum hallii]|uniref:probable inactive receptor kinase At3g02880 n=1 Tax=Panicum hallii TaxID=206008 RepID=UPI000DF4E56D|nr:probable inactive receptor kinase At3g02880 [Panicum hallii]